ncbi:MAG TPA: multiheme c-type cytochrome [Solimonas sp.]|nr:multiheme c-type cytochrome [Solimonas sp.]
MRIGALALCLLAAPVAADQALPRDAEDTHVGVVICSNSTCHGASSPSAFASVQQNEFLVWKQKDPHARAYASLGTERAQQIAARLGIDKAQGAAACLVCHSDYVPAARRGKNHSNADGVACEACHGGAQRWLGVHSAGITGHEGNLKLGMFPTENPKARARLCLSCHQGTASAPMSHRLLGAGHPRLALELDSYTLARPAHHIEDADYRQRKPGQHPLKTWSLGQLESAAEWRALFADTRANPGGTWPEFSFYQCFGCHRAWGTGGSGTGMPRLDTSRLEMVGLVLDQVAPERAAAWDSALQALQRTDDHAALVRAMNALDPLLDAARGAAAGRKFAVADARALFAALAARAARGEFTAHATAEQATYAAAICVDVLAQAEPALRADEVQKAVEALYAASDDGSRHDSAKWHEALNRLDGLVRAAPSG